MSEDGTIFLDQVLDPLTECLNPEAARRIVDLKLAPKLQARLDELAARANEGALSDSERQEYQEYVEGLDLIAIFKAKARLTLLRQAS